MINFSSNKKYVIAVILSSIVVLISICILGIGTGIFSKGEATDKMSSNETPTTATINNKQEKANQKSRESATEKATAKKYTLKLAETKVALKTNEVYSVEFAEGVKKKNLKLIWSSSDKDVAIIDKDGNITAVSEGKAVITCKDNSDNSELKLDVTVTEPVYPDDIQLDKMSYILTNIGQPLKLTATISPKDTVTEKKLTWTTDDESVATVKDGIVKSVGEGTAIITCTTENGYFAQCEITVETVVKAEEIYVDYSAYEFSGPQTEPVKLTAYVYPENTSNAKVSWHSTDNNVALVNEDGEVTIVGDGECDVVCTTTDGTYLSSVCEITSENSMAVSYASPNISVYVPVNPIPADTPFEEALRYVGVIPYIWGGTDLSSGVDCSGFLCAVYERFGVNLWGIRTDLYLAGTEVKSIEEAKAGDILCYPGHVAMYDGNGGRVHAYDEGYMIMRDTNIDGYYTIRRIME